MTCVRQSRRFTCASSCSSTIRSRSSGHRFASSGISTDGVKIPAAIGIEARALSRNVRRRVMPSSAASSTASGSHGASTTRTVRRDIHRTATSPTNSRPTTANTPAAQIDTSAIVNEMRGMTLGRGAVEAAGGTDAAGESNETSTARERRARGGAVAMASSDAGSVAPSVSVTMGNCQRGSASERTGSTSALVRAMVHTRWRTAADARPSTSVARPARPRTSETLMRASAAGSQSPSSCPSSERRIVVISAETFMARLRSDGLH